MSQLPTLIADLALILICAGVMTLLFKKLKQPLVLGYVVAGFLASPHMPYTPSVMDTANIKTWADIGVIFLLFALSKIGAVPIMMLPAHRERHSPTDLPAVPSRPAAGA